MIASQILSVVPSDVPRIAFGFANPNHAASIICALMPFCWKWRCARWIGWMMMVVLAAALAATQSRAGLVVMTFEIAAYGLLYGKRHHVLNLGVHRCVVVCCLLLMVAVALWLSPRLTLDDSILNRPRIWLAGLRLFAANPSGVGLGNSGALASVFLLDGIPEIRTMVNAHITFLAELGWIAGWTWFAFIWLALFGGGIESASRDCIHGACAVGQSLDGLRLADFV